MGRAGIEPAALIEPQGYSPLPRHAVRPWPELRIALRSLPRHPFFNSLEGMEVRFTSEQEARLAEIATKAGTGPEHLVKDVVERYLADEARFLAAVEKVLAAAERDEFIDEDEMDTRVERMFQEA